MPFQILVVEDSPTQAEGLRALLEEAGYEVVVQRDGSAARNYLDSHHVDAVLSDIVMPGLSGYELCRHIKSNRQHQDIPVVLLTSLTDPMAIVRGLECGADNYITKPYEPEPLLARIRHVLENRHLRRGSRTSLGVNVRFLGNDFTITSDREQILDLFISSVEDVIRTNEALERSQRELAEAHAQLEIYAREKAREARESTERYQALMQNAADAIFVLNAQGDILEANTRALALLGYPLDRILQYPLASFITADEQAAFRKEFPAMLAGNESHAQEWKLSHAEGGTVDCEISVSETFLEGESLVLVIARDIGERKRTEEALRQSTEAERANRAKSEFLSRMSHELRTPLNAILGFGQLLETDVQNEEDRESVEQILRAGKHLLTLIDEVLDLSKIEAGRVGLSMEPVSVEELLEEALGLVRPIASQQGIVLHSEVGLGRNQFVHADLQRIKQVILNFLSNAIKYNRSGGTVRLSTTLNGPDRIRILVRDTGPGIPQEKLHLLFRPFERLGAEQHGIEGTGLGLALSKGLVETMGGQVGVESTLGEGSTFWVELARTEAPLDLVDLPPEPTSLVTEDVDSASERTVLYIEDNLSNLRLVERVLARRPGLRLLAAMQGSMGVELAREYRPELILLDLNLPDVSGEEVLQRLRQNAALRDTPVVIISADAMPSNIERFRKAGVYEYLTKPLDVPRFLRIVDTLLELNTGSVS